MQKLKLFLFFIILICLFSTTVEGAITLKNSDKKLINIQESSDDFYFVQLTDTHVMHKLFDKNEMSKKRLTTVLKTINSFEKKPAFIVITGDLCEWSGSGFFGALNCITFSKCFYEKDKQLYADPEFTIPVYTTPGNHDYIYNRNLKNYHRFIDKNHADENDRYVVTYEDTSLFFMDSGPIYNENPIDAVYVLGDGLYNSSINWLEHELSICTSRFKIVLMHHPAVNLRTDYGKMYDVIARNREKFIEICKEYDVDLVLAGHTHEARIFDGAENFYYDNTSLNCSLYPTLYVQTDDCKEGIHYRNVSFVGNDIWLEKCEEINLSQVS